MTSQKLLLDYVYSHEESLRDKIFLTQPMGAGQVADFTWGQAMEQSRRMAAYLKAQGFEPGARIALLSKNCAHFFMAELAIWMAGYTTVAIFPTELSETVHFVLDHSGASLLFIGKLDTWEQQKDGVPAHLPRIRLPLSLPTTDPTWDSITAATAPLTGHIQRLPSDLAFICYTSGSTGQPKGVMHDFEHATRASVGIVQDQLLRMGEVPDARILSYLPLAHIYERAWVECASLVYGKTHVYFAEALDTFLQDLQRARPTSFISVPRLWLKFQQGVFTKLPPKKLDRLLSIPILGRIVGRKVLKGLGLDQAIMAGSGSAPIPAELIDWYRRLGLPLFEGYAMTEDFAYSHTSKNGFNAAGCVGVPLPGVEVRFSPEGEVLIKSPGQMVGYFKRPDLDAEAFTGDGFFRTGDKGVLTDQGLLRLTGRVKEIFKTSKGKYVSPAPIENQINAHPSIEMAMVSGVGQPSAYAIVVLAEALRPRVNEPALHAQIEADMAQLLHSVNSRLADYEKLQMLVIAKTPWSMENGCLTPTMKIKRSKIEASVKDQVDAWYAKGKPVLWA